MYNQSKSSASSTVIFSSADAVTSTNSLLNRKPKSKTHHQDFQIQADICAFWKASALRVLNDDDTNVYSEQVNILKLKSKTDKQVN